MASAALTETNRWVGRRLDGIGDRTLGRVAGIHLDAKDSEPRWVVVRLGPLAGCTAIPFDHVVQGADRLWTAYERDRVREAPRLKPREALTAVEELHLCAHWGIRDGRGRTAELASSEADVVTAVPADS